MTSHTIGVISDTHGLLRPEVIRELQGVEHILHAGDVGKPEVLTQLAEIAPVTAVRGNVDRGEWAQGLPQSAVVPFGDQFVYLLHNIAELDLDPAGARFAVLIYGHSHQPVIQRRNGVLWLNPGSVGPRRFALPVCLARLRLGEDQAEADLIYLELE